ncbi:MAG: phenylalanine--tRNA ligase subunit alpha, partial [Niameybacter sp.]
MKEKLEQIQQVALSAIQDASDLKQVEDLRVQYLGKKGELTAVLRGMKDLTAEERPVVGQMANEVREALETALGDKKEGL